VLIAYYPYPDVSPVQNIYYEQVGLFRSGYLHLFGTKLVVVLHHSQQVLTALLQGRDYVLPVEFHHFLGPYAPE